MGATEYYRGIAYGSTCGLSLDFICSATMDTYIGPSFTSTTKAESRASTPYLIGFST